MFGRSQPKVEVLALVPADDLPWRHEGVLVLVSKGLGALRWRVVKANGATKRALVASRTSPATSTAGKRPSNAGLG